MSKYYEFKIKLPTGEVITELAKDHIDALEQVSDMYDIPYDDLTKV